MHQSFVSTAPWGRGTGNSGAFNFSVFKSRALTAPQGLLSPALGGGGGGGGGGLEIQMTGALKAINNNNKCK